MHRIVRRLLDNRRSLDEVSTRGETTLRTVLCYLAELLDVPNYDENEVYVLHHANGIHDDNTISNLVLMNSRKHSSYHSRLYHRGIDKRSPEALEFFKSEGYDQYCAYVGRELENFIKCKATIEADDSDKLAIKQTSEDYH